jgi:mRNA-degrading endonuclease RelE of RelBE toxin-antitoxin system
MKTTKTLQVVVETPEFLRQAATCMDEACRKSFIDFIAENPLKGDLIVGTGGARKVRWASDINTGKSGGVRIIYYYHNQQMPIFLFTVYGKNQKANLSQQERNLLKTIISHIVNTYGGISHE